MPYNLHLIVGRHDGGGNHPRKVEKFDANTTSIPVLDNKCKTNLLNEEIIEKRKTSSAAGLVNTDKIVYEISDANKR